MSKQGGIVPASSLPKPVPQKQGGIARRTNEGKLVYQLGRTKVDIVEVIDTTGSMYNKIDGLLATSQKFVDKLAVSNIDWQMAVVGFGDLRVPGDSIVRTLFSHKVETVKQELQKLPRYDGGGNYGESCLEAIEAALSLQGYRQNAIKVLIMLTDDEAVQTKYTVSQVTAHLQKREVLTFVVALPLPYYQEMAAKTGGEWFAISADTDFLSILDRLMTKVAKVVVNVQEQAGGSVSTYLQLKQGRK